MGWFGEINDGQWNLDVNATVREVGLGILRAYRVSGLGVYLNMLSILTRTARISMNQSPKNNSRKNGAPLWAINSNP